MGLGRWAPAGLTCAAQASSTRQMRLCTDEQARQRMNAAQRDAIAPA
ncbi:MAG: hypothetical protein KA914_15565 [Ottowia sp.]|nr:hypothetical protein [Ottowia sp.]